MGSRRLTSALLVSGLTLSLLSFVVSCGPGPDDHSGGDETRAGALPVEVGSISEGRVSRSDGDSTDWKRFGVPHTQTITINVYWDNPDIDATLDLRNVFGISMEKVSHSRGERQTTISEELADGEYFLEIRARSGSSVYTLEIVSGPAGAAGDTGSRGGYTDPRPE
jgi:hypothetical protein